MAKDNEPENTLLTSLETRVKEMEVQLTEALKRTTGLTWNLRNWEAVKQEMEVQRQRFNTFENQINGVKNQITVLQQQFQQFQQQRAIELNNLLSNRQTVRDNNESS